MKVTRDKTENSQAFLTIEMESDEIKEALEKAYHRLVKKANVPGFRRGKAPRDVLERHIGKDALLDDAVDHLLPEAYEEAVKEQGIETIGRPRIELAQAEPVVFKVTAPLKPVVDAGDYRGIRLTPEPVKVSEEDINSAVERLRHGHATWVPAERPVALNDLVSMNIFSSVGDKPFINQKGAQYQVVASSAFPAPGFGEQLVGMKTDEEKDFKIQLPPDYPNSNLAGKEVQFKVNISEIKQEVLPELSDDFAKQVDAGYENVQSLREHVAAEVKRRLEERANTDFEDHVVEAAVTGAKLEYPQVLVEAEIDHLVEERTRYWQRGKASGLEDYLRSINKTELELRDELVPLAKQRVEGSLVLERVAEEEKIEVSDSEIKTEIDALTRDAGESKDELGRLLNTPQSRESVKQRLIVRKTVRCLAEIARGSAIKEEAGA